MKIKWGVIGCGGIADRRTIPGMMLADNAELIAVMDPNMALAEKVKEKYNAKYAFTDYKELLELKEIDAVYIASPVFCHEEQAISSAKAKKHILLEKPMGLTTEISEKIKKCCEDNGVKIGVGLMMRFSQYHREMKKIISEGKLGEIVSMRAQFTCWFPDMANNWRQKFSTGGGGALTDMGIHCIDLLQFISSLKAKEVASFCGTQIFNYEVEDAGSLMMRMENGSVAYIDANFNIPDDAAICKLEIYGTEGSITAEGTVGQDEVGKVNITITGHQGAYDAAQKAREISSYTIDFVPENMYTKQIESFGNAILNNTEPEITADDAINVQKIIEAAYKSNKERKFIEIE